MMNALALGLVLTSLVTAGFYTPTPESKPKSKDDVIVKEGRRVVVVEYEKDVGNTKVSISPQDSGTFQNVDDHGLKDKLSEKIENMKEGTKDFAAKSRERLSEKVEDVKEASSSFKPRELVCDAYGKCKHKIASAIGKKTDAAAEEPKGALGKVKDTVSGSAHKAYDKVEVVKESVEDSARRAKEKGSEIKEEASRRMEGAKEKVSEKATEIKEEACGRMEGAKEKVSEKASGIKEEASRTMEGAKEKVSEKASGIKEEASRRMEGAKEKAKEGKKELSEIMRHARDVVAEVFNFVFSAETAAPVTGILHLMGFAAAYGMCVWVTFGSSHVLAGSLPRQQFALVQSRIYPLYFKAMGYSLGMALLGHLMSPSKILGTRVGMFRGFDLMAALAMILLNLLYLEPRATKVMHERMKMEKEEGTRKEAHSTEHASTRAPDSTAETAGRVSTGVIERGKRDETKTDMIKLSPSLQRLNSYSSFLNVMTLVSLTWHLVRLGQRLHMVC